MILYVASLIKQYYMHSIYLSPLCTLITFLNFVYKVLLSLLLDLFIVRIDHRIVKRVKIEDVNP